MEPFAPAIEHIQQNMNAYIGGGVVALIIIVIFRRIMVPVVLKALEVSVYFAAMHLAVSTAIRALNWFQIASSEMANDPGPGWTTPRVEFWNKELYNPEWLIYMELGFCAVILVVVYFFRPLYIKPPKSMLKRDEKSKKSQQHKHMSGSMLDRSTMEPPQRKKGRRK